jgi:hypothetical protein
MEMLRGSKLVNERVKEGKHNTAPYLYLLDASNKNTGMRPSG